MIENSPQTDRSKLFNRIKSFFSVRQSFVALLLMVILVGMGEKMAERFLPIYLIALGGSTLSIGLLNGMDNLLSALYSFPGGYLSDRLGHKKALLVFNLIAIFGYLIVIIFPTWQAVLVGAVFFLSWSAISLPATMSLVSAVMPKQKRTLGVSIVSIVKRIPMSLGPVVGGILIGAYGNVTGVRLAFSVAVVFGVVAAVLQQKLIEDDHPEKKDVDKNVLHAFKLITPDVRNLLVSDILVRFAEQIPYAFVVVWAINNHGLTALQFGVLTTIEMVVAVLVYIPIAYLADRNTKKPFVAITFGFFTLFPLILLFTNNFASFVVAFIIRGLKEFGEPTRKALIMDLAPEGQKARVFGTYYLIRDVIVSVAAFSGALLWNISPQANFLTAFGFGALGTLYFIIFGKDMGKAPATSTL